MIILIIDEYDVLVVKRKRQSPISADINRPVAFQFPMQRMESPARRVHIAGPSGVIKSKELPSQLFGVLRLNTGFRTAPKKSLDTGMSKALYHHV